LNGEFWSKAATGGGAKFLNFATSGADDTAIHPVPLSAGERDEQYEQYEPSTE
jgi:hypothetical protein